MAANFRPSGASFPHRPLPRRFLEEKEAAEHYLKLIQVKLKDIYNGYQSLHQVQGRHRYMSKMSFNFIKTTSDNSPGASFSSISTPSQFMGTSAENSLALHQKYHLPDTYAIKLNGTDSSVALAEIAAVARTPVIRYSPQDSTKQ